jgi:hypothetical protein
MVAVEQSAFAVESGVGDRQPDGVVDAGPVADSHLGVALLVGVLVGNLVRHAARCYRSSQRVLEPLRRRLIAADLGGTRLADASPTLVGGAQAVAAGGVLAVVSIAMILYAFAEVSRRVSPRGRRRLPAQLSRAAPRCLPTGGVPAGRWHQPKVHLPTDRPSVRGARSCAGRSLYLSRAAARSSARTGWARREHGQWVVELRLSTWGAGAPPDWSACCAISGDSDPPGECGSGGRRGSRVGGVGQLA